MLRSEMEVVAKMPSSFSAARKSSPTAPYGGLAVESAALLPAWRKRGEAIGRGAEPRRLERGKTLDRGEPMRLEELARLAQARRNSTMCVHCSVRHEHSQTSSSSYISYSIKFNKVRSIIRLS